VSPPPAQAILYLVTRILDGLEQAIDDGKGFRAAFENGEQRSWGSNSPATVAADP